MNESVQETIDRLMSSDTTDGGRSGFVAVVGPPNVGKSSFINAVLGIDFLAVSRAPQTTIQSAPMLYNVDAPATDAPVTETAVSSAARLFGQIVLVDTPGIAPLQGEYYRTIIADAIISANQADAVIRLVPPGPHPHGDFWRSMDEVLARRPVFKVGTKGDLQQKYETEVSFVTSARKPEDFPVDELIQSVLAVLPESPPLYDPDWVSTRATRSFVVDWIRETLLHDLSDEVPHATGVWVDRFQERDDGSILIDATLAVDRTSQKQILVGSKGAQIKKMSTKARHLMSKRLDCPVHLFLHVSVKPNWRKDPQQWRQVAPEHRKKLVDRVCAEVGL